MGLLFFDAPVVPTQCRDLRRVCDHQNLTIRSQRCQPPPDSICRGTAHAAVDLVKDHRKPAGILRQANFQRQKEPAEFTARGDLVQRSGRRTGVCGDSKGHGINSLGAGLIGLCDVRGKDRALHFERGKFLGHRCIQPLCSLLPLAACRHGGFMIGRLRVAHHGGQCRQLARAIIKHAQTPAQFIGKDAQVIWQNIMFARQSTDRKQTFLDIFKL